MNGKRIQYFLAATLIGAIICVSPVAVWAWNGAPGTGESCVSKRLDLDGDGLISADEFAGGNDERFKRLDADGDGYINSEEARARNPKGCPGVCAGSMGCKRAR